MNNSHRARLYFTLARHGLTLTEENIDDIAEACATFEEAVRDVKKPHVILTFTTEEQKNDFIGGLLDGWGEGAPIDVDWDEPTNVFRVTVRDDN